MKRRNRTFAIVLILLLIVAMTWFALERTPSSSSQGSQSANTGLQATDADVPGRSKDVGASAQSDSRRLRQLPRESVVESHNVPIAFWGKVVDQNDQPIPGALVSIEIRRWTGLNITQLRPDFSTIERRTGLAGSFEVTGAKGDVLSIKSAIKEGYTVSPEALRNFGYNISTNHTPDPNNPVIIRMWKLSEPAALVVFERAIRIRYDATPTTLDLLTGQIFTGQEATGDLRIKLLRNPLKVNRDDKFDWTVLIQAIDGGLIESADEMMYQAPETGYSPQIEINMPQSRPDWTSRIKISMYLKSRNGQCYGRISLQLDTNSPRETTGLLITSTLNPSGSRNLEPGGPQSKRTR